MVTRDTGRGSAVGEVGLIWTRCRAELRGKWRTTVVLVVLLGIGSGVALTAFAGARRTHDAVSQFVRYSRPDDGGFLFGSLSSPPSHTRTAGRFTRAWPRRSSASSTSQRSSPMRVRHYLYVTTSPDGRTESDLNVIGVANPDLMRHR